MRSTGAIACGHPETAQAAEEILRDGGNAFDAILAAMCAAGVVEPVLASLGGGGFLMARTAQGQTTLYDFFVDTPRQRPNGAEIDFYPIQAQFKTTVQEFHIGLGAMATPGQVKGLFAIHRDLASLPLPRIVEPAVKLAREGIPLRQTESYLFEIVAPIFLATSSSRAIYGNGSERLLREGELLRQSALADTLECLAREGEALFYEGEIAEQIVRLCRENGGLLNREDLANYKVRHRKPFSIDYRDARIDTNPPPSSGGILIAFALELLRAVDLGHSDFGDERHLSLLARTMELTNRARVEAELHKATTSSEELAAAKRLLHPELLRRYRAEVAGQPYNPRGTTHISIVDKDGNMAAMTLSNGEGCGTVLPGTGIMLNNMLGEEDLNPAGFHNWPTGSRISSMMSPSLAHSPDGALAVLGSGGSNRIRTAILQVLCNLIDFGMTAEEAVLAPRLHVEGGITNIEGGFPEESAARFAANVEQANRWPDRDLFFGGVHAIRRDHQGRLTAAGDPRRGGVAMVL